MQSAEYSISAQVVLQSVYCVSDYRTWKDSKERQRPSFRSGKLVAVATKIGELYYLNFHINRSLLYVAKSSHRIK